MNPRTPFCTIDAVHLMTGDPLERIYGRVDTGALLWVWDISAGDGQKRNLRFWTREIAEPGTTDTLRIDEVISQVIPARPLRQWEFALKFQVHRFTMIHLRSELEVQEREGRILIPRASIEKFLRNRWCGRLAPARQTALALK